MRFSDAIRAGSKLGPQAFGTDGLGSGSYCANAAAMFGAGFGAAAWKRPVWEAFPELKKKSHCPSCVFGRSAQLAYLVTHLNDVHLWTREHIADWYEANFEQADEALIAATVVDVLQSAKEPVTA